MTKPTKADQVRAWLNGSDLNSREIAEAVGCHQGFVLAIKQRMLHPERERSRARSYAERYRPHRAEYQRIAYWSKPGFRERAIQRSREYRARKRAEAHAHG